MSQSKIDDYILGGRLPGEEVWFCERCETRIDPLRDIFTDEKPPFCSKCRAYMELDTDEDRKADEAEKKAEAEHWAKVDEMLAEIWRDQI